jgi:Signal transduction histidine kinase
MKISYKQKLFLYFFVLFAAFTCGIVVMVQSREKDFKTKTLEEKLDTYADIINSSLINQHNDIKKLDSLIVLLPQNIRLTLIDKQGQVLHDNAMKETENMENHVQRPEILSAKKEGKGSDIRVSSSNQLEYLYYAKRYNSYYIRVALPYDIQVQRFLKADNVFLYYIIGLFLLMLLLINLVSNRFGKSIKQLRDFTHNEGNSKIEFPYDELGEIGTKIAENYRQLKESKQTIALEREKLLQHIHSSEEGVCFFSADKHVEFYNGLFIQHLNIIADESNSDPSLILSDPSLNKVNAFLLDSDRNESYFETNISRQGKTFTVQINIFEDDSFEIIIRDITKQEKTRQMKQEMTGNIAHELRTPVTSICGYLETVLEQPLEKNKERDFLSKAYNQTLVLSELIRDMGLITKIEEAPQSFHMEVISIQNLLLSIYNDLEIPMKEKGITMKWAVSNEVIINGNRNLLYSVFRNLTDNVIRHAGSNVKILVKCYREDAQFYHFSYSDTGIGIVDEQHLNRLFERFYRINEGRTRDTGGSGLGLSIVKNAILFHKGAIVAKNKADGGLEFLFKLSKKLSN